MNWVKLLFLNRLFSFEFLNQLLKQLLLFLMKIKRKGTTIFINGPTNLKIPKNLADWIVLEIWSLDILISVDLLLLNAFLIFILCLIVSTNSWGRSFLSKFLKLYFTVVPILFLTSAFSFFNCDFTFTLLYSTIKY